MPEHSSWQRICVITEYIGVDWIDVEVDLFRAGEEVLLRTSVRGVDYVRVHSCSPQQLSVNVATVAAHVIRLGLRRGLLRPEEVVEGGLLAIGQVEDLCGTFLAERDAARAFQRRRSSPIVEVARELRLDPDTEGSVSGMWEATCPTRPHQLLLQTSTDLFYCGYCRVGGGPDELRALVAERHRKLARPHRQL